MQLYCPNCQAAFSGATRCPRCDGRLFTPDEPVETPAAVPDPAPDRFVRPSPAARIGVGTVLALGLYLGLRKVLVAAVLATTPDPAAWWLSPEGLVAVFGSQAVAALFGALIAGAGRSRGFPLGFAVGGLCGMLFLAAEVVGGTPATALVLYLHPPTLALAGGLAAVVGGRVWPAVPDLDLRPATPKRASSIQLAVDKPSAAVRPTRWLRLLAGAAIMVAGVTLADTARLKAQKASGGMLRVESVMQGRFLSWQIATFAVLLGGVTAAAGTGAGFRHGIFAGVLAGAGVIGVTALRGESPPALDYWLGKMSMAGLSPLDPGPMCAIVTGVLLAAVIGGWLGAQIFLPLAPEYMRSRRFRMGD